MCKERFFNIDYHYLKSLKCNDNYTMCVYCNNYILKENYNLHICKFLYLKCNMCSLIYNKNSSHYCKKIYIECSKCKDLYHKDNIHYCKLDFKYCNICEGYFNINDSNSTFDNHICGDTETCSICYENDRNVVFIPCKHFISCNKCTVGLKKCPYCRNVILEKIRIFTC